MFATGDCLIVSPDTKEKVPNKVTSEKISQDKDRKLLMIIMVVGQVVNEQKCKAFCYSAYYYTQILCGRSDQLTFFC